MPDFWPSCGYRLLTVGADGRLTVTDDFLRSYLLRPEFAPVSESCPAEQTLHDALIASPRCAVTAEEIGAMADPDARENYGIWLRFRTRLLSASSLEAAYVGLFQGDGVDVPPLFVQQLTQILLRHILTADAAPMEARAAEMLFRTQKIAITEDGAVMAADETTVELFATASGLGSLVELLAQNRTPARASTSMCWTTAMRRPTGVATSARISRSVSTVAGLRSKHWRACSKSGCGIFSPSTSPSSTSAPSTTSTGYGTSASSRYAASDRRASGLSRDGDGPRAAVAVEAAESPSQPAARPAAVISSKPATLFAE